MAKEDAVEEARRKAVEAQAQADRDRELARRAAREDQAKRDESVIQHGPASE